MTKWVKLTKGHLSLQLRIDFCLNIPKAYHKIVAFDKDSKRSGWRSSRGGNSANVVLAGRGGGREGEVKGGYSVVGGGV